MRRTPASSWTAAATLLAFMFGACAGPGPSPSEPDLAHAQMRAARNVLGTCHIIDSGAGVKRCAIADFDSKDGLDIAVADEEPDSGPGAGEVRIYLNNGAGAFGAPKQVIALSGARPVAIVARTFDHTAGRTAIDLAVACVDADPSVMKSSVRVFRGAGDGSFAATPHSITEFPTRVKLLTAASLDGARAPSTGAPPVGTNDLVVVSATGSLFALGNPGAGVFAANAPPPSGAGPSNPSGVGSGDLDNDKDIDPEVVISGSDGPGGAIVIFTNLSRRKPLLFRSAQKLSIDSGCIPADFAFADICGDSFLDLVTVDHANGRVCMIENRGGVWDWWMGMSPTIQVVHPACGAPLSIARARFGNVAAPSTGFFVLVGSAASARIEALETPWLGRAETSHLQTTANEANAGVQVFCADMNCDSIPDAVTAGWYLEGVP